MWLLLFFLWIILNGRITVELVIFGILIATGMRFFADRVIGFSWQTERRILKNLPVFGLYLLVLVWEIIKAAWTMMTTVFQAS